MYYVQCTYYDLFNVAMKIPLHVCSIYSVHIYSSHVLSFRAAAAVSRLCIMYILCGGSSPYPHSIIWTDSSASHSLLLIFWDKLLKLDSELHTCNHSDKWKVQEVISFQTLHNLYWIQKMPDPWHPLFTQPHLWRDIKVRNKYCSVILSDCKSIKKNSQNQGRAVDYNL